MPEKSLARIIYEDSKEGVKDVVKGAKDFAGDNSEYVRQFGLTMVYIKASGLIFFSLVIFVIGLIAFLKPKQKMLEAQGIVSDSNCQQNNDVTYNCNFKVKFNDSSNKELSFNTNTTKKYSNGDIIKINYDQKEAQGIVSDSNCQQNNDKNCNFKVKFNDSSNKEYTSSFITNTTKKYFNGDIIKIYYDQKDPQNNISIENKSDDSSYIFYTFMIIFGVFGFISGIIWIFLSQKFDFVAKAEGVKEGISIWKNIF